MSTLYKTKEQVKFARLFERLHWRKSSGKSAWVARELGLTRSAVSQYLSAKSNPSQRTIQALVALVEREELSQQARVSEQESSRLAAERKLSELERSGPPGFFQAALSTIDVIHASAFNSKLVSPSDIAPASASAAARNEAQEAQPKPPVVAPSDDKRGRGRGAGKQKGHKPEAPGQAQE